mmetsp:Transcript_48570/g.55850  ORF Transcript_48570/g.55850 Transcript_48570/m.55850 type:complete len:261 (+) Transcript_48570:53-835(+)
MPKKATDVVIEVSENAEEPLMDQEYCEMDESNRLPLGLRVSKTTTGSIVRLPGCERDGSLLDQWSIGAERSIIFRGETRDSLVKATDDEEVHGLLMRRTERTDQEILELENEERELNQTVATNVSLLTNTSTPLEYHLMESSSSRRESESLKTTSRKKSSLTSSSFHPIPQEFFQRGRPQNEFFLRFPQIAYCQYCETTVATEVDYETGAATWILCIGFSCICLFPCAAGMFCSKSTKDVLHFCKECNRQLGVKRAALFG